MSEQTNKKYFTSEYYDLKDSEDKDEVTSQYFKIDMISKDVYGDVNESLNQNNIY